MKRSLTLALLVLVLATGGCSLPGQDREVEPSGSTAYFFKILDQADALADYITLPPTLADTLPNRSYASTLHPKIRFTWTKRVVVGRVVSVSSADEHRARLRIRVEETFPASAKRTVDVLVPGFSGDEDRYLASAASLGRVVVGIDSYRGDDKQLLTVVAMAGQLFGVLDDRDRIRYPVLRPDQFRSADWDRNMTTLEGLRSEAAAPTRTIDFDG